jgi:hypothetical protein
MLHTELAEVIKGWWVVTILDDEGGTALAAFWFPEVDVAKDAQDMAKTEYGLAEDAGEDGLLPALHVLAQDACEYL